MQLVGIRDLSRNTRTVIEQLLSDGGPLVVTKDGRAVAILSSVNEGQAAAIALGVVPDLLERRERAAADVSAGRGRPFSDLDAEFEFDADSETGVYTTFPISSAALAAASIAAAGVPVEIQRNQQIQEVNVELVSAYLAESVRDIVLMVTRVNEAVAEDVGDDDEPLDPDRYLDELSNLARTQMRVLGVETS